MISYRFEIMSSGSFKSENMWYQVFFGGWLFFSGTVFLFFLNLLEKHVISYRVIYYRRCCWNIGVITKKFLLKRGYWLLLKVGMVVKILFMTQFPFIPHWIRLEHIVDAWKKGACACPLVNGRIGQVRWEFKANR